MLIKITMIERYYEYVYLDIDFNLRKYDFLMNIFCGWYGIQTKMKFVFIMNL